ncbi:serine O-acetyltransferase [Arsenicicoccus dermatophilus]|uniref:serine O-acetyltransferase n=1 Tax=Arsenicicoccus dermatophilus TaxID=1076331 RepID=UPI0039173291
MPAPSDDRDRDVRPSAEARVSARRGWVELLARRLSIVDQLREDRQCNEGLMAPGFQAVAAHRLSRWARDEAAAPGWVRRPVGGAAAVGQWVARAVYGIEIPGSVELGRRVTFAHQGGIVLHHATVVEDGVVLRQGVTIGLRGDEPQDAQVAPRIGAGASLGAGAVIVGPIVVGEGAQVGANAVVTRDVPDGGRAYAPRTVIEGPRA